MEAAFPNYQRGNITTAPPHSQQKEEKDKMSLFKLMAPCLKDKNECCHDLVSLISESDCCEAHTVCHKNISLFYNQTRWRCWFGSDRHIWLTAGLICVGSSSCCWSDRCIAAPTADVLLLTVMHLSLQGINRFKAGYKTRTQILFPVTVLIHI